MDNAKINLCEPQKAQMTQLRLCAQGATSAHMRKILQQICQRPMQMMLMIGYLPMKIIYIVEELSVLFMARKCMSSC